MYIYIFSYVPMYLCTFSCTGRTSSEKSDPLILT